ncbi:hypothetical protein [Kamptonema sp. UHCC 0994]|uniref:hypothetical protein n=1 Tax=Kamptonema sp. UHCC 0994 TaxID=3031329 RepID=UPI0023B9F188|nr:hypothetical protein [Kamptonema sp. UHCC 0994]MDF0553399.1 hypothetical protein [Kamptonema sp. UHCC 0994]
MSKTSSEDIFFASHWEFDVYMRIRRLVDPERIKCQYKVEIKPKTYVYPAMFWKCDFAVVGNDDKLQLLIEAKGFLTDDFRTRLKFLQYTHPELWRIVAVVKNGANAQRIDSSSKTTLNLEGLEHYLHYNLPIG